MNERDVPVYNESRALLYPVPDALHLVYGTTGETANPWNRSKGGALHPKENRPALSARLKEAPGITYGKRKLYRGLMDLIEGHTPAAAFVYTTGTAERLGDEVDAVCSKVEKEKGIPVIPLHTQGHGGVRKEGGRVACEALFRLMGTGSTEGISPVSINILDGSHKKEIAKGLKTHCCAMGVEVVSVLPGDSPVDHIRHCHGATANVVLGEGAMLQLAVMMKIEYGIPFIHLSGDGPEMADEALCEVTRYFTTRLKQ
ncbi:hypothetical protein DSLASN_13370 [Desulfoluna limicola]|uniref:Nitrogenase/oxidoreductase component 1 domain-containing protein n=1 Tax=Desulfoluna limicola TaxID=2810562 RepID=A0ABM7PEI2_9BACT|nr:nitrogenase component 1 [Desulfoluna limicola]BCS95705.1 hypothetical protein DSLASN_13370 [Desulfoluna limicola]